MHPHPALTIGRYRARFTRFSNPSPDRPKLDVAGGQPTPPRFSDFPGNAWRGALGHALKRTVCVTRQPECHDCVLYRSCLYPYFWETPPHAGAAKMRKYETAPHPFVLHVEDDAPLQLEFTLLGQANRHLAVFLHALTQAAAGPRGISGNLLTLDLVEQAPRLDQAEWRVIHTAGTDLAALPVSTATIPAPPDRCTLDLLTPLRVKREGRHVGPRDFTFADLFGNLLRRISMLTYFHTDTPLETDFRALKEAARQVVAQTELEWKEHSRYSRRQQSAMQLGGVVGQVALQDVDLAPFWADLWPYLWLGQFTHAGSGATMGLGRYRVLAASAASLPAQTETRA